MMRLGAIALAGLAGLLLAGRCVADGGSATTAPGDGPSRGDDAPATRLIYQVDLEAPGSWWPPTSHVVADLLAQRTKGLHGVVCRPIGTDRVEVTVPDPTPPATQPDVAQVRRAIETRHMLEFHVAVKPADLPAGAQARFANALADGTFDVSEGGQRYRWVEADNPDEVAKSGAVVSRRADKGYVLLSLAADKSMVQSPAARWRLRRAYPTTDQYGFPAIGFEFDAAGARNFARLTGKNIGRQLAATLDGRAISLATIQSTIRDRGIITGRFTADEVTDLARKLGTDSQIGDLKLVSAWRVNPGQPDSPVATQPADD